MCLVNAESMLGDDWAGAQEQPTNGKQNECMKLIKQNLKKTIQRTVAILVAILRA